MPSVDNDGVIRDFTGRIFFSLDSPRPKHPLGRPRKKRVESQVMDKRTIYCSQCHNASHNRKACKKSLSWLD